MGSRLPLLRRLWTASADGFAGLPGLTSPRGWHVLARDAVARWVRPFAWEPPQSRLPVPATGQRCQLAVYHARRCDQLVGEVVQAPPTVAVVRLLDEISDTVSIGLRLAMCDPALHYQGFDGNNVAAARSAPSPFPCLLHFPAAPLHGHAAAPPLACSPCPLTPLASHRPALPALPFYPAVRSCARCWMLPSSAATCTPMPSGASRHSRWAPASLPCLLMARLGCRAILQSPRAALRWNATAAACNDFIMHSLRQPGLTTCPTFAHCRCAWRWGPTCSS